MHNSEQMDSLNSAQLCRLCLQTSDNVVNIWKTVQDSTIATILVKHFWFQINKNDGLTEWLCQICWIQTKSFHEFYESVEQFQKCYLDSLKRNEGDNDETVSAVAVDVRDANLETDLTIIKCEETEFTSEVLDSQINEEDDCSDISDAEPQNTNDKSPSSHKTSQDDDNRKVSNIQRKVSNIQRKVTRSISRSEKMINRTIKEEQNKEVDGQIREWFTMKCDICNDGKFGTWMGVKRHYRNVHQMIGYLKCCDRRFHRRYELLGHIRHHNIAPESTKLNAQIREYFTMKCDICPDIAFATLVDVRRHYREAHKMRGYLICCGNKFDRRYLIIAHIRSHTNPDEHRCEQCEKSFSTKIALRDHIDNHVPLDSRAFKCNLCSSSFAKASTLKAHIRNIHTSKNGEKFTCEKCNKNYPSELLLRCHIRTSHDNSQSYVCEICARQFKSKHALRNHVICEHSTTSQPKVQCNICGNWLKNDYGLARHMKEQHHDAKPANCPICNKVVPNKHRLGHHIRSSHGERKYECVLCDKAFRCAKNLKEHVATHTGEDLYKCQYCDRKFKSNANLYSHRKKAHLTEWAQDNEKIISLKKSSADNKAVTKAAK